MTPERPVHLLGAHFYLVVIFFKKIFSRVYMLGKYQFFSKSLGPHILYVFNRDILLQYIYLYTQMKVNRLSFYIEHCKFWLLFET